MLLKYFYNEKLAQASYMVGCQAANEAIIVDPGRDIDLYLRAAKANGMKIVGATETHIHADFVSGARELAERVGAKLYLSDEGGEGWQYQYVEQYTHQLLKDGDRFTLGNLTFEVMHTPGHTPEHISLLLTDGAKADAPMGIFTGDFVFVGSIGRPDLLEKAAGILGTAEIGAKQMFQSLQRFKQLPDYLQLWPGHGAGSACGKGLGAIPSSTVGYEKLFNGMLQHTDEAVFAQELLSGQPESPKYFAMMKQVNKAGPNVLQSRPAPEYLPTERLSTLLDEGAMIVDTRPAGQFAQGHLQGTVNIPLPMVAGWAGWLLDYEVPFYMIVDSADVVETMLDLQAIGLDNLGGLFETAAVDSLSEEPQRHQSYRTATSTELADDIQNKSVTLVDIRNDSEWQEGHIPQAHHAMLGYLPERAKEFMNGKSIVVQCRSGARGAIGASILKAQGAKDVINMVDGLNGWEAAGLPVVS